MATKIAEIVILDYSGTLSTVSPQFSRPEILLGALRKSGLADLGVATPEIFWERIVEPTWTEGSTTPAGYGPVIARQVATFAAAVGAAPEAITAAAARFVSLYLDDSPLDPRWRPLLTALHRSPDRVLVVATDHYAEATGRLIAALSAWNIPAQPAASPHPFCTTPPPVLIANSADLGAWKAERRFWERLKACLPPGGARRVFFVDDFGYNEEGGDPYGQREKVLERRQKTEALLADVFRDSRAETFPFFLDAGPGEREAALSRLIAQVAGAMGNK